MPVWGRGGLTLPVSKKCKNEKIKKKKKKKEEKEEERDKERELHRHDVWSKLPLGFTNGGRELRTVRTHTSLFGGRGPCRCLEGSGAFRRRHSKRANETTPTRHQSVLPQSLQHWFYLGTPSFFSNVFGGASSSCDPNVQQTTSGRFQRRARGKFGKVPGSCNRFQAWSCDFLRHRTGRGTRTPVRDAVFDMAAGNTWHCQQERVINDVVLMWTRGVGQRLSSACTHVQLEWFIFFNFAKNFHLNSWSMPFWAVQERKTKPERDRNLKRHKNYWWGVRGTD